MSANATMKVVFKSSGAGKVRKDVAGIASAIDKLNKNNTPILDFSQFGKGDVQAFYATLRALELFNERFSGTIQETFEAISGIRDVTADLTNSITSIASSLQALGNIDLSNITKNVDAFTNTIDNLAGVNNGLNNIDWRQFLDSQELAAAVKDLNDVLGYFKTRWSALLSEIEDGAGHLRKAIAPMSLFADSIYKATNNIARLTDGASSLEGFRKYLISAGTGIEQFLERIKQLSISKAINDKLLQMGNLFQSFAKKLQPLVDQTKSIKGFNSAIKALPNTVVEFSKAMDSVNTLSFYRGINEIIRAFNQLVPVNLEGVTVMTQYIKALGDFTRTAPAVHNKLNKLRNQQVKMQQAMEDTNKSTRDTVEESKSLISVLQDKYKGFMSAIKGVTAFGKAVKSLKNIIKDFISTASDMEKSMVIIQHLAGTAGQGFGQLNQQLFAQAMALGITQQEYARLSHTALRLGVDMVDTANAIESAWATAALSGSDANRVLEGMVQTANVFQISFEHLPQIADVIATVGSQTTFTTEKLANGLANAGQAAVRLGIDFDELAAIMATMADAGMRPTYIGRTLNTMLTNLYNNTNRVNEGFAAVGIELYDFDGTMRNTVDVIGELFERMSDLNDRGVNELVHQLTGGVLAQQAFTSVVRGGSEAIREWQEAIHNGAGTVESLNEAIGNTLSVAMTRFTEFNNFIKNYFGLAISDVVLSFVDLHQELLYNIAPSLETLVPMFQDIVVIGGQLMHVLFNIAQGLIDAFGPTVQIGLNAVSFVMQGLIIVTERVAKLMGTFAGQVTVATIASVLLVGKLQAMYIAMKAKVGVQLLTLQKKLIAFIGSLIITAKSAGSASIAILGIGKAIAVAFPKLALIGVVAGIAAGAISRLFGNSNSSGLQSALNAARNEINNTRNEALALEEVLNRTLQRAGGGSNDLPTMSSGGGGGGGGGGQNPDIQRGQQIAQEFTRNMDRLAQNLQRLQDQARQALDRTTQAFEQFYRNVMDIPEDVAVSIGSIAQATRRMRNEVNRYFNQMVSDAVKNARQLRQEALDQLSENIRRLRDDFRNSLRDIRNVFSEAAQIGVAYLDVMQQNLQDHATRLIRWRDALRQAMSAGVIPEDMLAEIANMGPAALEQLEALNGATSNELSAWLDTWREHAGAASDIEEIMANLVGSSLNEAINDAREQFNEREYQINRELALEKERIEELRAARLEEVRINEWRANEGRRIFNEDMAQLATENKQLKAFLRERFEALRSTLGPEGQRAADDVISVWRANNELARQVGKDLLTELANGLTFNTELVRNAASQAAGGAGGGFENPDFGGNQPPEESAYDLAKRYTNTLDEAGTRGAMAAAQNSVHEFIQGTIPGAPAQNRVFANAQILAEKYDEPLASLGAIVRGSVDRARNIAVNSTAGSNTELALIRANAQAVSNQYNIPLTLAKAIVQENVAAFRGEAVTSTQLAQQQVNTLATNGRQIGSEYLSGFNNFPLQTRLANSTNTSVRNAMDDERISANASRGGTNTANSFSSGFGASIGNFFTSIGNSIRNIFNREVANNEASSLSRNVMPLQFASSSPNQYGAGGMTNIGGTMNVSINGSNLSEGQILRVLETYGRRSGL